MCAFSRLLLTLLSYLSHVCGIYFFQTLTRTCPVVAQVTAREGAGRCQLNSPVGGGARGAEMLLGRCVAVSLTLSHLLIRSFPAGCRVFLLLVTRRYSVVFVAPFIIRRLLLISACLLISVLGFLDHFPEAVAGLPGVRTPAPTAVLARPRAGRACARSHAPRSRERLTG